MKEDVFRGATKLELKVLYKYGIIIPVKTNDKECDSPRREQEKEAEITSSPKKRPHLQDEKSDLLNTPQSDITPDPEDNNVEPPKEPEGEAFVKVTKKDRRKSSGAL